MYLIFGAKYLNFGAKYLSFGAKVVKLCVFEGYFSCYRCRKLPEVLKDLHNVCICLEIGEYAWMCACMYLQVLRVLICVCMYCMFACMFGCKACMYYVCKYVCGLVCACACMYLHILIHVKHTV